MVLRFATGATIRITHILVHLTATTDRHGSQAASSSVRVPGTAGAGAIPGTGTEPAGMDADGAAIAAAGDIAAVHPIAADTVVDIEADLLRVHSPAADSMAAWAVEDTTAVAAGASMVAEADSTGVVVTAKTRIERQARF